MREWSRAGGVSERGVGAPVGASEYVHVCAREGEVFTRPGVP